jgi:hypothetical protein
VYGFKKHQAVDDRVNRLHSVEGHATQRNRRRCGASRNHRRITDAIPLPLANPACMEVGSPRFGIFTAVTAATVLMP